MQQDTGGAPEEARQCACL
uniref:Uncharacterized protein n=1 Tax=Pseudomonas aeruginosa TaxID=287 RepID=Q9APY2_PSEAI|nr:hypothetical protein [Pseudomonas aeruginosa]